MGEVTKIEWTDHTFNPWIGCQKVSPGCDHCYAEAMMDHRYGRVRWGPRGARSRTSEGNWRQPLKWARQACGHRPRVFCASLADVFDNKVPKEWRGDLWELIRKTPELDWMLLTKRPENIRRMLPNGWPWDHVWLGTTTEDQRHYDQRWRILSDIPAAIRFISYEPALGSLRLHGHSLPDWVICGGESGAQQARMMEPAWARAMRDQCRELGVAFFMKQMTKRVPIPKDLAIREWPGPSAWAGAKGGF
jgi:protein gp37